MRPFLLFTLWAPLGSMGEVAVGERRTGFDRPAKSAVLGLVAASLGIERREEEKHAALAERYGLALRVEAAGAILLDYHTAQVPPTRKGKSWATRREELAGRDLGTILSKREYREEPRHTVALWTRLGAPHRLEDLAEALRRPRFTLYLGRKSCPLGLPPAPRVIEAATLAEAFAAFDKNRPEPERRVAGRDTMWRERPHGGASRVYVDTDPRGTGEPEVALGPGLRDDRIERRRDLLRSRRRWQFGLREELVSELVWQPVESAP